MGAVAELAQRDFQHFFRRHLCTRCAWQPLGNEAMQFADALTPPLDGVVPVKFRAIRDQGKDRLPGKESILFAQSTDDSLGNRVDGISYPLGFGIGFHTAVPVQKRIQRAFFQVGQP